MPAIAHINRALLHRLVAAGCIAVVLALGLLAASPKIHVCIHDDAADAEHDCVIVLFDHGVTAAFDIPNVLPPKAGWTGSQPAAHGEIFLKAPRYLHQPERGPPVC